MKNITKIFIAILVLASLSSCRDESLNPLLPVKEQIGLVRMEKISPSGSFINMNDDREDLIDLYLTAEGGDVDSYTIYGKVKIHQDWYEYKMIKSITEFPGHLTISAQEIIDAMDLPEGVNIPNYSRFRMVGKSQTGDIVVDLQTVVGAGFSPSDNPDGVASGLITHYLEQKHLLVYQ